MKPRSFIIAAVLLAAAACVSHPPVQVKVEMPGVPVFPPGLFSEFVVTDFRDDAPSPDFALGREIQGYFAAELGRAFKGQVSRMELSPDGQAAAGGPEFWKHAGEGRRQAAILTGSAGRVGDLSVISAATGEVLYTKTFREERDYNELDKPAEFAFAELADRIRARLFSVLFAAPTVEERTLLRR